MHVVDRLKAIEIDEENRALPSTSPGVSECFAGNLQKHSPVWQSGQNITPRCGVSLALGDQTLPDIASCLEE
jgi:hypothetical protein